MKKISEHTRTFNGESYIEKTVEIQKNDSFEECVRIVKEIDMHKEKGEDFELNITYASDLTHEEIEIFDAQLEFVINYIAWRKAQEAAA